MNSIPDIVTALCRRHATIEWAIMEAEDNRLRMDAMAASHPECKDYANAALVWSQVAAYLQSKTLAEAKGAQEKPEGLASGQAIE